MYIFFNKIFLCQHPLTMVDHSAQHSRYKSCLSAGPTCFWSYRPDSKVAGLGPTDRRKNRTLLQCSPVITKSIGWPDSSLKLWWILGELLSTCSLLLGIGCSLWSKPPKMNRPVCLEDGQLIHEGKICDVFFVNTIYVRPLYWAITRLYCVLYMGSVRLENIHPDI